MFGAIIGISNNYCRRANQNNYDSDENNRSKQTASLYENRSKKSKY